VQRVREGHQRLNAGVPSLLPGGVYHLCALQVAVLLEPLLGLDDLERISAGGQYLSEERIGIEGDGRDQVVDLLGRQEGSLLRHGLLRRGLLRGRRLLRGGVLRVLRILRVLGVLRILCESGWQRDEEKEGRSGCW
jgi:hypothetical protein